jgi:release factor glutamine methyltransferase
MTAQTALLQGTRLLEDAVIAVPRLTAEVLLSHALHRDRVYLYSHPERELTEVEWIHYGRYLHERLQGKPTQYITGRQEFYGREFRVSPDVLIPRPETEHLVETVVELARKLASPRIVDVGTGSGCIALALAKELPYAEIHAVDTSLIALEIARSNALKHGLQDRVRFQESDLLNAFSHDTARFDFVISNPPYVSDLDKNSLQPEVRDFEPHAALFAGPTGFDVIERLIPQAQRVLKHGGWLVMEIGLGQDARLKELLRGWSHIQFVPDLQSIPRVAMAQLPK